MKSFLCTHRARAALARSEGLVDGLEFLLSALAVFLVVSNEFVPQGLTIPWLDVSWAQLQVSLRTITWFVFTGSFVLYALSTTKPITYIKSHWLELIICATWLPYYDGKLLVHLHSVLSLEMLTLVGSVAHMIRVARWVIKRFADHPLIVIFAAASVIIVTASAIMTVVEPQTFPNMSVAAWFCVETIFTVGYGDITPKTELGRLVTGIMIFCGVGLGGLYVGFASKVVSQKLLKTNMEETDKLARTVEQNNELLEQLVREQKASNELTQRLLQQMESKCEHCKPADTPATGDAESTQTSS